MAEKTHYWVGTSGWNYDEWQNGFYPEDCPKRQWFDYYSKQFKTVEVNATFYRFFKDNVFKKWYEQAPDDFQYILKAPRLITHRKYLKDVDDLAKSFMKSAKLLKDKLGLILLQLSPNMPYELERLRKAILAFQDSKRVVVEFRHERWLKDEVKSMLKSMGASYCCVDSPNTKLNYVLTSDVGYIRLHGRTKWYEYNYSSRQLHEIADLAKNMRQHGAKKVFIFFNNDVKGYAPKNALSLQKLF